MKIVVIISSYNRYDKVLKLLTQINNQKSIHNINIVVSDDNSDDIRYLKLIDLFDNVKIIRSKNNNGKKGYWRTINKLLDTVKDLEFDFLIQLDDDFILCDNFINQVVMCFNEQIKINKNVGCMSLHLNSELDLKASRWGLGTEWVDGGTIYTKNALNVLGFNIIEIPQKRWLTDKNKSSGVWQQVSNRLRNKGLKIIKVNYSFIKHNDEEKSVMNEKLRLKNPIKTYKYIDDFKEGGIDIKTVNKNKTTKKTPIKKKRQTNITSRVTKQKKKNQANLRGQNRRLPI